MSETSLNVSARLMQIQPERIAVHAPLRAVSEKDATPHRAITFAELNADLDRIAHGLSALGVTRGTRVALMVPPGVDFFAITFALFKIAAVPVMVDPGMGLRNLASCLAEAEPHVFIGIAKAHLARRLFGWAKASVRTTINVGRNRFLCTAALSELRRSSPQPVPMAEVQRDELAAILFTSGSTGLAKGVEYTHGIFSVQVELLQQIYGIQPGEVDLCTFPLFALFGIALGMTCVIPDLNASKPARANPYKLRSQVRQFGVTQLFGSPAVLRRLSELPESRADFATLKRVISAGAPATVSVLEQFVKQLPTSVQIFTPYGATEALPVANIGSDLILKEIRHLTEQGHGVCIGTPVPGVDVRIIAITDEPIATWSDNLLSPQGEVGEIVVRGPIVTKRYFRREAATRQAKIVDPASGEVLHRMGDVGYFDALGRLWFCGRKSHRVVTPHGTLFTDMVEPVFNSMEAVWPISALIGVTRDGINYPVLCIEIAMLDALQFGTPRGAEERRLVKRYQDFARTHEKLKSINTYILVDRFPMDPRHNSKIFREKLAVWADRTLGPRWKGGPA